MFNSDLKKRIKEIEDLIKENKLLSKKAGLQFTCHIAEVVGIEQSKSGEEYSTYEEVEGRNLLKEIDKINFELLTIYEQINKKEDKFICQQKKKKSKVKKSPSKKKSAR